MKNYENRNGIIYEIEKTDYGEIIACFGSEKRLHLLSETETETTYEWQKFDLEKGAYIPDEESEETATFNGREYKPEKGRITVRKEPNATQKKMLEIEMAFAESFEENQKLKDELSQTKLALAEIFESTLGKDA